MRQILAVVWLAEIRPALLRIWRRRTARCVVPDCGIGLEATSGNDALVAGGKIELQPLVARRCDESCIARDGVSNRQAVCFGAIADAVVACAWIRCAETHAD